MTLFAEVEMQRGGFSLRCAISALPGRPLAVVGRNGSGKSTLLHCIAGLLTPGRGRIVLDGRVLHDTATKTWVAPEGRDIALVFQDQRLFPHLTVRDNVAFALRARRVSRSESARRADALLERLGVGAVAPARPAAISGGQAQRVAVARALAAEPRALLLDEPLSAVDAGSRDDVLKVIAQQLTSFSGVCILVTHDQREARALAADVVRLDEGGIGREPLPSMP